MDILFIIILFCITWPLSVIMADNRGRSQFGWAIFGLLLSPILSILILLCLGETYKHRINRLRHEEEMRLRFSREYFNSPIYQNQTPISSPIGGKCINDLYKR